MNPTVRTTLKTVNQFSTPFHPRSPKGYSPTKGTHESGIKGFSLTKAIPVDANDRFSPNEMRLSETFPTIYDSNVRTDRDHFREVQHTLVYHQTGLVIHQRLFSLSRTTLVRCPHQRGSQVLSIHDTTTSKGAHSRKQGGATGLGARREG